jgi:peptidoglycan/xylan/chitin deacetylase (PgdA/CDA1 family)
MRRYVWFVLVLAVALVTTNRSTSTGPSLAGPAAATLTAANQVAVPAQEFVSDGAYGRSWNSYSLTQAAIGPPIVGAPSAMTIGTNGLISVFGEISGGDLGQYVNDGANGRLWNGYDLSAAAGTGPMSGTASTLYTAAQNLFSIFVRGSNGDLAQYVNDNQNGRVWNAYDLSAITGGGQTSGSPDVVSSQGLIQVFVPSSAGDLIEYVNDNQNGRLWNAYDLSAAATGGQVSGTTSAVYYPVQNLVHVYVRGSNGDLVEYVDDNQNGRVWNAYDLSASTGGGAIANSPDVLYNSSLGLIHVYAQNTNGDLMEYVNDNQNGRVWNAYDLSVDAGSGKFVAGVPDALYFTPNGTIHIYVRGANNDLVEFVNDELGGRIWNAYDVSQVAYGPAIGTDPSALIWGGLVHVYVGGPTPMGGRVLSNLSQVPNSPYDLGGRVVALTFDDGPSGYTSQILQVLMQYRAPASFQIIGSQGAVNLGLLRQEAADGFALVNHTWTHVDLVTLSPSGWVAQVDATDNLLASVIHRQPSCLRPPYGYTNGSVVSQLASRGLGELMWDVDPSDYLQPGASVIVQRVLGALHPGAIIIMHDGGGDRSQTVAALPAIINGIRSAGYSIVEVCG